MIRVTIGPLTLSGHAMTRLDDGRVALVRGGCPGDEAEIDIVGDEGRWLSARLVNVLEASRFRVEPPCPYFGQCGGCQWQHVRYDAQLAAKTTIVADAFERTGRLADIPVEACIPSSDQYGYRNKVDLIAEDTHSGLRLGLPCAAKESFVPLERCLLLPDTLQGAPRALTGALRYLRNRSSDPSPHRVALRTATHTHDVEVALWTDPGPFPRQMAAKILSDAVGASGVVRVLVKGRDKHTRVTGVEVLKGRGRWRERIAGHTLSLSAPTPFKVNTAAAEALVSTTLDSLDPGPEDRLLDMYAGAGTFALPSADRAAEVVAVESSSHSLGDLRRNLESARLWVSVIGGDASRELAGLGHFDLAVVDPPRSGIATAGLTALAQARPRRIAYLSCDPVTLARDAAALVARGYTVVRAAPVDLRPQTCDVETIALFESK